MKILHQLGHNHKWALDSYFKNEIGSGFIFSAYNFRYNALNGKISGYSPDDYVPLSSIDLQFYGNKSSMGGKMVEYPFHPIHDDLCSSTCIGGIEGIKAAIRYQKNIGINRIIVPNFYYTSDDLFKSKEILQKANAKANKFREDSEKYYMTICLGANEITDDSYVESLLQSATDMNVDFDGYYIVCDASPEYKKKVSIDFRYYENLRKILLVLGSQGFETILGYANWDALVFLSLVNIDYITIGTYENLRNFSIKRFTESQAGGPSKGWYFSEKLLNFVKAQDLDFLRYGGCLHEVANERNIFSDVILEEGYIWNTHKPDVHKNYLLSISRLLEELAEESDISKRANLLLSKIERARELYQKIATDYKVFLQDESSDYHLGAWSAFIRRHVA